MGPDNSSLGRDSPTTRGRRFPNKAMQHPLRVVCQLRQPHRASRVWRAHWPGPLIRGLNRSGRGRPALAAHATTPAD